MTLAELLAAILLLPREEQLELLLLLHNAVYHPDFDPMPHEIPFSPVAAGAERLHDHA